MYKDVRGSDGGTAYVQLKEIYWPLGFYLDRGADIKKGILISMISAPRL